MALTQEEIVKIRSHLGYLNVEAAQTFVLGVPAGVQTQFMVEGAVVRVLANAEWKVRQLIERLDKAECKIDEILDVLILTKAEDVEYNPKALETLAKVYMIHQQSLANLLGIVPNPFDQRIWLQNAGNGVNVPVVG